METNELAKGPKISFIGAGSTVFMTNIVGDLLGRPALSGMHIALMDIDPSRLAESEMVAQKIATQLDPTATISSHTDQRAALDGANFVIVAFQVGGLEPCTITDFEIPKKYGLRQTIADTVGIGGIMRGLRTIPHLWSICADMTELCPQALLLQYVNPMAINTWAISAKFPNISQVGLCHSVPMTVEDIAHDLRIPPSKIRYKVAGINHMAFFLTLEEKLEDGSYRDLYPDLHSGYAKGEIPLPSLWNERCPNLVRYEMMTRLGYFVTESSEHFAEYVPWFIKSSHPDLIERFGIPLDEYPTRCVEQIEAWKDQAKAYGSAETIEIEESHEYASDIVNSIWTGEPSVIYGNVPNGNLITSLPQNCAVEVPCLVDRNGIQPTQIGSLPTQLTALIRTNINVQELTVAALLEENREHIYHAAMLDPHTGAELGLDQIWALVDELIRAHGPWLPDWVHTQG